VSEAAAPVITISPKVDRSGGGVACVFFKVGLKTYGSKADCEQSRDAQEYAFGHGIGPAVLSAVFPVVRDGSIECWGYVTELAKTVGRNWDGPEGFNGRRSDELRQEHDQLQDLTARVFGRRHADGHWGNVGLVERDGREKLVWIDFCPGVDPIDDLKSRGVWVEPGKLKRPERPKSPACDDPACHMVMCVEERKRHERALEAYQRAIVEWQKANAPKPAAEEKPKRDKAKRMRDAFGWPLGPWPLAGGPFNFPLRPPRATPPELRRMADEQRRMIEEVKLVAPPPPDPRVDAALRDMLDPAKWALPPAVGPAFDEAKLREMRDRLREDERREAKRRRDEAPEWEPWF
jgi:hypothetical protein